MTGRSLQSSLFRSSVVQMLSFVALLWSWTFTTDSAITTKRGLPLDWQMKVSTRTSPKSPRSNNNTKVGRSRSVGHLNPNPLPACGRPSLLHFPTRGRRSVMTMNKLSCLLWASNEHRKGMFGNLTIIARAFRRRLFQPFDLGFVAVGCPSF